jgi:transcriptional regulator with XRE-family HTH domain
MKPRSPQETEHWKEFGRWLVACREATRTPRRRLARAAGISDSTLANYEKGGRHQDGRWWIQRPTRATLAALARALDVPEAEMLRRADPAAAPLPADPSDLPVPAADLAALLAAFAALTAETARLTNTIAARVAYSHDGR